MKNFKKPLILWIMIVALILSSLPMYASADGEKPGGNVLKFQLDNKTCVVNGSIVNMDVAPTSRNGRTLIPVVYVAKPLGAKVEWDGTTRKVT
ncbi:copper amine oxidase N-terminal domain-containing protein, partial [Bacillus licheniformis]|uniref:copper amine oxidase N-terminal domain-containing protein n=1 Tax=Bacillus licheniformis TaxID=1402 RepID=UPI000FA9FFBC